MSKRLICLSLLLTVFAVSAQAQFIGSIQRQNPDADSGDTEPAIASSPLAERSVIYVDRTHIYLQVPTQVVGAQYVMTANDDKNNANFRLIVTMSQNATLYLILDNRLGNSSSTGQGVNPDLAAQGMTWVTDMGFVDTTLDVALDESANGSIDRYSSLFSKQVKAGDVLTLMQQNSSGNMYAVAALGPKLKAYDPIPASGSQITDTFISLGWTKGATAASHDVYFGETSESVTAGTGGTFRGNQTAAWFMVGMTGYIYPTGLVAGKTYYWRIDEVEANGVTKHTGDVWSFSLPIKTAYNPNPPDAARLIDPNADLSWTAGFGAKLHVIYFGTDQATIAGATTGGTSIPLTNYDPGPMLYDKAYYWRVDEFDGLATIPGPVWSFKTAPKVTITDPNLLVWWKFDDGQGNATLDSSGYGHHGTVNGATWTDQGQVGGAFDFGGDGDYIVYPTPSFLNGLGAISFCVWVKSDVTNTDKGFYLGQNPVGNDDNGMRYDAAGSTYGGTNVLKMSVYTSAANQQLESSNNLQTTTWQHYAMTWSSGQVVKFYVNGVLDIPTGTAAATTGTTTNFTSLIVGKGGKDNSATAGWDGMIDDFRIYNKALTADELKQVMRGEPDLAWNPNPPTGVTVEIRDVSSLSWSPGDFAVQHDVFFGTDPAVVAAATTSSPEYKGRRSTMTYPIASLVSFGTGPYCWRIDEINNNSTISTGRLWRFSVADYLVIDEMEDYNNFPPDRIFETWIDGYGNTAVNGSIVGHPDPDFAAGENFAETSIRHGGLQSMPYYYNCNFKYSEATMNLTGSDRNWTQQAVKALSLWFRGYPATQGSFTEAPAGTFTMTGAGADVWGTADQFHFAWKMLNGPGTITAKVSAVTNLQPGATLNEWAKAGVMIRETLDPNSAYVFMLLSGTNTQGIALQNRPTAAASAVTTQQKNTIHNRPLWLKLDRDISGNFTASHANDVAGAPDKWTNMSLANVQMTANVYVGLALTSHTANAKAQVVFSNVTFAGTVTGAQWTDQDIGIRSNQAERMFVSIKGTTGSPAIVYHPDPQAALLNAWTQWNIPLTDFAGVNLSNVDTISIGFGTKGNTSPGGSGLMYFDDIRLYRSRCFPTLARPDGDFSNNCVVDMADLDILSNNWLIKNYQVTPQNPDPAGGPLARYPLDGSATDVVGGRNGTVNGTPTWVAGKISQGISLKGVNDYVGVTATAGDLGIGGGAAKTITAWAYTRSFNNGGIFDMGAGSNGQNFCLRTLTASNRWRAQHYGSAYDYDFEYPSLNTWVHFALVYDGAGRSRTYADGQLVGTKAATLNTANTRPFEIGRYNTTNYFDGVIDEVRIYNRALSQGQAAYLAGKTTTFDQQVHLMLTPQDPKMDLSPDGQINFKDYAVLIDSWLEEKLWP